MKKLVSALLISLPCYPMQKQVDTSLVEQILTQESTDMYRILGADLSKTLAQEVLHNHPIIHYLLRNIPIHCTHTFIGPTHHPFSAKFNEAEDMILTASHGTANRIWHVATGQCLATFVFEDVVHEDYVNSAVFSPTGDKVVTASRDTTAKIWNVKTGKCLATLVGHVREVNLAVFNDTGDRIVTASFDTTAKIWNASSGNCLITLEGHTSRVVSAVFNKRGDRIVTASWDKSAKIWHVQTGECMITLKGHEHFVNSAAFNTKGDRIVTTSYDRTAKLWHGQTGECLATFECQELFVNAAVFNEAGDKIVTTSLGTNAKIWHVPTGKCLMTLKGKLNSAIINRAGDRVLTAYSDGAAKIWDLTDRNESEQFLLRTVNLTQAIILNAIYEVIVARRLVTLHGKNAFSKDDESIFREINANEITLDFNRYPHLQEQYDEIPALLRKKLDHFVSKRTT